MSDRLLVATRKGLFIFERRSFGEWAQAQVHFLGEPVSMALSDARDGSLYAALNLGHFGVKLHRRGNGAQGWEECAVPAYPKAADDAEGNGPSLAQIWALETAGPDETGVLWAGTIPGGLFRSTDRGASWQLNEPLWNHPRRSEWMGGGYDNPGIHSVCVDPRDSRHVSVAVSTGGVWQTRDAGATWTCTANGMYAEYMPPERRNDPNMQDVHRLVACAANPDTLWAQHHNGIFRSTDGGENWQGVETARPSKFGFAVAVHPKDPDTAWFAPAVKDACRIPVDGRFVVSRTRDGGKTFDVLDQGLPTPAYDLVYRHGLEVDATGERLAMGSTTGGLWVSEDSGERWSCVSAHLPPIYCVRFG